MACVTGILTDMPQLTTASDVTIVASGGAAILITVLSSVFLAPRRSSKDEAQERARLSAEVLGQETLTERERAALQGNSKWRLLPVTPPGPGDDKTLIKEMIADNPAGEPSQQNGNPTTEAPADQQKLEESQNGSVYDQLLINDYALGLTQARRAFNVSMTFMTLGGIVLILGISLTIFRADTGRQITASAITSAAGILTSGLAQLFRGHSAKALKHLETQAAELRKDVRTQTRAATALRLLDDITDPELRGKLQAALILQFTNATLPDLRPPPPGTHQLNGTSPMNET
jgi:hypothetical protein